MSVPASAGGVSCGQTITTSTTLNADVGPCSGNGIIIGANNITLNLNGRRVFATTARGEGAGVLLQNRSGVTVMNGTVQHFDGGIVIQNGGRNRVSNVRALDNIGQSQGHPPAPGTLYGDGIAIEGSSNNVITGNTTSNNGPYSGIGIYQQPDTDHPFPPAPAVNNLVQGNVVTNNVACRLDGTCDNIGIRIEPNVSPGNVISGNRVIGNGIDGISVFNGANGVQITGNYLEGNGFLGSASGDGIRIFGHSNYIAGNTTVNNKGGGVSIGRRTTASPGNPTAPNGRNNRVIGNTATGNGVWDLWDSNIDPPCDNNQWNGNKYQKANPACTTIGGQQV